MCVWWWGGGGHKAGRSCVKKFSRHADVNKCDVAASYTSLVSARGANKWTEVQITIVQHASRSVKWNHPGECQHPSRSDPLACEGELKDLNHQCAWKCVFYKECCGDFLYQLWAHGPLKSAPECGVHSYWSHRLSGWYRPPERRIWVGSERVTVWIKQLFRQEDEVEERHRYVIIIVFIISKHTHTLSLTQTHTLTTVPAEASGPSPSTTSYWKFIARTHSSARVNIRHHVHFLESRFHNLKDFIKKYIERVSHNNEAWGWSIKVHKKTQRTASSIRGKYWDCHRK